MANGLLLSYPSLIPFLLPSSSLIAIAHPDSILLSGLRNRLATLRRSFRLFRFLESFASAWAAATAPAAAAGAVPAAAALQRHLDVAAKSFTGMYLLLESATFPEALDVPGLSVWGQERAGRLNVEAQRFWFLGLVCAVLGGGLRVFTEGRPAVEEKGDGKGEGKRDGREEKKVKVGAVDADAGAAKVRARREKIVRRMVADVMDLAIPGSVVGWVPLSPGVVSFLMLWSTVLTGREVWERCGAEVAAAKGVKA
ncbi:hypothetical protein MMYC01_208380 [Madurella mycetomatis]|uniref:Uncharacterized protein n=1 Tax=Madurella mycetomatis TaxID=100816 RepID=A0A175W0L0_9PEZI|nr:hypothetical protein MMYC01_208380 [Madurella mycetomatis]